MRKGEEEQSAKLVQYMLSVLLGGMVALLACFLLLILASIGISKGWLSEGIIYQITLLSCVVGAYSGTLAAVHKCCTRALMVGLAVGAVLFLLLLTIGVLCFDSMSLETGGIGLLCSSLCGGAVAGILCSRRTRSKKKRRK